MATQLKPTKAELEILNILWESGQATVKEVHDIINRRKPSAYTTVLKTMQIMRDKGLVKHNDRDKAHIYRAAQKQDMVRKKLARDLADRAFGGSRLSLIECLLEAKAASAEEVKELRRLVRETEKKVK
jgi:BlaI family transcriptional regulator, penicillinase repressor